MLDFKNITLRNKVTFIQLVTAFVVVLICCALFLLNGIKILNESSVKNKNALAEIIGVNAAYALEFKNRDAANKMLLKLKTNPDILNAVIFDKEGKEFARYDKPGGEAFAFPLPGSSAVEKHPFFGEKFIVGYKIADKDFPGTVMIRSEASGFRDIILIDIKIAGLILLVSVIVALLISSLIQHIITKRVLSLVYKTKQVTETGDYSIRVFSEGKDEIGILSGAFNSILDQVEKLQNHLDVLNSGLEKQVQHRTEKLNQFKQFFDNSKDFCCIANTQGYFEIVNPNFEKILGYSEKEMQETQFFQFIHPDDIPATLEEIEKLKTGAITNNFVNRYRKKDGSYLMLEWNTTPDPVTGKLYAIARDITKRKVLEGKLQQFNLELEQKIIEPTVELSNSEKRFRALMQNSSDAISLMDASANVIYQSPAAEAITGFSMEDRNGELSFANIHPDDFEQTKQLYTELLEHPGKGLSMLIRAVHKKGHYIWLQGIATNLLHDETVKAIVVNFGDVTKRIEFEEIIKSSEKKTRLIMNAAIDAIICINTKGIITFWNPQAEKTFGWKEEEVSGKLLADIIIPPAFQDMHARGLENYLKTGHGPALNVLLELSAVNRAGKEFPIELTILPINQGGEVFFCAFLRDISQRKHSEVLFKQLNKSLEKKAAELLVSNTDLESFAYIASHDLQEPLRMVSSFMRLLENTLEGQLTQTNKQYLNFAIDGAKRMKLLIEDLLQYSRVGFNKEDFIATDLNEVLQYVSRLLEEDIKKNQAVITVNPLPVITANKTLITQLFVNLVGNALKYHGDKDTVIEVGCTSEPDNDVFYVSDNGIGIDPKFFDKIFIIFQRLHSKTEYSGTGIGLSICKKIVETHKGKIWIESELGRGSIFYFSIPKLII